MSIVHVTLIQWGDRIIEDETNKVVFGLVDVKCQIVDGIQKWILHLKGKRSKKRICNTCFWEIEELIIKLILETKKSNENKC